MNAIKTALLVVMLVGCSRHENESPDRRKEGGLEMHAKKMSEISSGYRSTEDDWSTFLTCWREAVKKRLGDNADAGSLPNDVNRIIPRNTSSYNENIVELDKFEASHGLKLPKSYRDFAAITGGNWLVESAGTLEVDKISSSFNRINEIGAFKVVDKLNWGGWHKAMNGGTIEISPELYYRYGYHEKPSERQDDSQFRWEYIDDLIKVGELGQGTTILLNFHEITFDAEWQAWTLSPKFGAMRFRSFAELMQYVAYQDISQSGGVFMPANKLRATCAQYLKTAATD